MANEKKKSAGESGVRSAGDAGAGELVKVVCNRKLSPAGKGQVVLKLNGVTYRVRTDQPMEVSRELYEQMREIEVRGVQAVVLA